MHKDATHAAHKKKEKYVIPLDNFCGMNTLSLFEKQKDVLVMITMTQTIFFSFDSPAVFEKWIELLEVRFGKCKIYSFLGSLLVFCYFYPCLYYFLHII